MTAPTLDRLRDEIEKTLANAYSVNNEPQAIMTLLTRHIPADVLTGLLDGTMIAVPNDIVTQLRKRASYAKDAEIDDYLPYDADKDAHLDRKAANEIERLRAMLAVTKQEDRA